MRESYNHPPTLTVKTAPLYVLNFPVSSAALQDQRKASSPMRRQREVEFELWSLMRLGAKEIHWTSVGEREGDAGELSGRKKLSGRKRVNLQKVLAAFQYEFSCVFSLAKLKYGKPRLGESTLT